MSAESNRTEVMALLDAWAAALWNKDLDALSKCYADDVAVYDIGSHLVGFEGLRALWQGCFPYFPNPIGIERKDIHATIGIDVITMSFLSRVSGHVETDPAANSWYRSTVCFKKFNDGWKITQEHASIAYDFAENKLSLIIDD